MAMASRQWMELPSVCELETIWVRDCYLEMYSDIRDLTSRERGMRYIHISGSPGIGKSCMLWYVLDRLLNEEDTPAVIVELVREKTVRTYVFRRDGNLVRVSSAEESPEYTKPGVWLLTDQRYVGSRPLKGRTVLFASPKRDNWAEAEKTMHAGFFTTLYMPPWSVEELQTVYIRRETSYAEFWKMYYVAGGVVRYYFKPVKEVYARIRSALEEVAGHGVVNATMFEEGQVFLLWPTLDFSSVDHISFISEWAAEAFAIACFNGKIRDWSSLGGKFRCIDNPEKSLCLARREVKFFDGKVPGQTLKVDEAGYSIPLPTEEEIDKILSSRLVGIVDTGAKEFGDSNSQTVDGAELFASVVMRQGKGSVQYEVKRYGIPAFVVWMEAVRSAEEGEFKVKTTLDVHCTTGNLAGKELTIFINERLGPNVLSWPPSVLVMRPGERVQRAFDEPALRREVSMKEEELSPRLAEYERERAEYRRAHSGMHEFNWSGDTASVVIRSNAVSSRKIKLVFPPG